MPPKAARRVRAHQRGVERRQVRGVVGDIHELVLNTHTDTDTRVRFHTPASGHTDTWPHGHTATRPHGHTATHTNTPTVYTVPIPCAVSGPL